METLLAAARYAGARRAGYPRLRRPHEVTDLFREWLETHVPLKAAHVLSLVGQMRGGRLYDPRFGKRMKGEGEYAAIIEQRFRLACRRLGFAGSGLAPPRSDAFRVPSSAGHQSERTTTRLNSSH